MAPAELEAVLLEHPDVADVGVIGVADSEAGELPRAYVVKQSDSEVNATDLHDFVNGQLQENPCTCTWSFWNSFTHKAIF